jgi:hypothetical protein
MNNVNNLPAMNNAPHWNQQAPMMLLRAVRITASLCS